MRALIFGGKGQLGRDLIKVFKTAGEVEAYDLPEVDITDAPAVFELVKGFSPTVIVNAAAFTNVEGAEDQLEEAFLVNETGARNVADSAAYHEAPVIYFSTDFVFAGDQETPYTPGEPVAPISVYGHSKAAGEAATRKANPKHFIIRTAWLYGPGGNNFVEKILRAADERPTLKVVDDEIGSPTHTLDLAEVSFYLARTPHYGTYHAVNAGACSRFELARKALELAGKTNEVQPCKAADFPSKAQRPKFSVLDNTHIEEVTGHKMRSWEHALSDYLGRRSENSQ